jgi:hypothetical protein
LNSSGCYVWSEASQLKKGSNIILNYNNGKLTKLSEEQLKDAVLIVNIVLGNNNTIKGSETQIILVKNYEKKLKQLKITL